MYFRNNENISRLYVNSIVLFASNFNSTKMTTTITTIKSPQSSVLRPDDIERLHHAKEILISNLDNPPSLLNLARLVGINDRKLKQGFRQVFGTTVYGYFQEYRMRQAKRLLAEGSLNVTEVAYAVGYTSPSRFCDAFKRQFSITPKFYQTSLHS